MVVLKKNATTTAFGTGSDVVAFDKVVNTNNDTTWDAVNNALIMREAGWYNTNCTVVLDGEDDGDAVLELLVNGDALNGAFVKTNIVTSVGRSLVLHYPIHVERSWGKDASIQWQLSTNGDAVISSAYADVQRIV